VVSLGATASKGTKGTAGVRLRYFGPRPLIEDGSVRSKATSLLSGQLTWRLTPRLQAVVNGFNLLNRVVSDIDYYYVSRLPGEPPDGVADVHSHPSVPRTVRVGLRILF